MTMNDNVLHVRFAGRSLDVPLSVLDIGVASTDSQLKQAVARHLDVNPSQLNDYVVDRHSNGNWTLRPEAIFG